MYTKKGTLKAKFDLWPQTGITNTTKGSEKKKNFYFPRAIMSKAGSQFCYIKVQVPSAATSREGPQFQKYLE